MTRSMEETLQRAKADLERAKRVINAPQQMLWALYLAEREIHNPGAGRAEGKDVAEIVRRAIEEGHLFVEGGRK